MATEQAVTAGPILAAVSAVSAFAVNIHRNETREIAGQQFTPAVRFTVGNEPGDGPVLQGQVNLKVN
jgi:hypothetical protein